MQGMGRFLVTLVAPVFVVVGLHCGIVMPDIDQRTNLLLHRSIITHSPLIPAHSSHSGAPRIKDWLGIVHICDGR